MQKETKGERRDEPYRGIFEKKYWGNYDFRKRHEELVQKRMDLKKIGLNPEDEPLGFLQRTADHATRIHFFAIFTLLDTYRRPKDETYKDAENRYARQQTEIDLQEMAIDMQRGKHHFHIKRHYTIPCPRLRDTLSSVFQKNERARDYAAFVVPEWHDIAYDTYREELEECEFHLWYDTWRVPSEKKMDDL